ncbi:MAG: beta-carotene 15,15'-monooxygenase, partial [Lachnospiraceae bacterium oral taxon 082]|nr:beta-carotene 15,15'-monooxygenase [Lachnospiraceae bacterium oral taxon 082]
LIYLFFEHILNKNKSERVKDKKSFDVSFIYLLAFPLLAIVFVYARTYMLTGHIITSVYSSVWYKLGMETKYPYTIGIYKSGGMNMSSGESVDMIYRLFQLFIAPTKEVHIYIASPTVLIAVLAGVSIILFVRFLFKKNNNKEIFAYIAVLLAADALVSLISLFILNQIDGNYFILLFTLIIMTTCFLVERDSLKYLFRGLLPCIVFAFFITGLTNWAGVRGLSAKINDGSTFGIYNHHTKFLDRDLKERKEFAEAYEDLKELGNPRTLLLSDDDSLSALGLDIRTYTDITGSGGNPAVVKTLDHFKRYLDYAQIKYICVDKEYLKDRQRASDVVKYMYEEGSTKIYKKYGDVVIYKVDVKQN